MPRFPLRLALLLALCALALTAAPALAASPAAPATAPIASAAFDDEGGDQPEDAATEETWDDEEWTEEDWGDVEELCLDEEDWAWSDDDDDDVDASAATDDEDWDEGACDEDAAADDEVAPARLTALRATPARRGGVRVRFQLDRATGVALTLERLGARPSRRCGKPARAAGAATRKGHKARACGRSQPQPMRGSLALDGAAGANTTTLRTWKGRALEAGSYRLTAKPDASADGAASTSFTLPAPAR